MARDQGRLLATVYGALGARGVSKVKTWYAAESARLVALGDDELELLARAEFTPLETEPLAVTKTLASNGVLGLAADQPSQTDAHRLAIAGELFRRHPPPGIPPGSSLFDEQVLAAIHLLRGAFVHMDTGEGKTYALMVAAYVLACHHGRTYVVCANPYLASRDWRRTQDFWSASGMAAGLALEYPYQDDSEAVWDTPVVYTTLKALGFKELGDRVAARPLTDALPNGAALLDEVDAIVLEEANAGPYVTARYQASATKDWSLPLSVAGALVAPAHITVDPDPYALEAVITAAGANTILSSTAATGLSPRDRLQLLQDVELCYIALHEATPGIHYEVRGESVQALNLSSGWWEDATPGWVYPLEQHLGKHRRPVTAPLATLQPLALLATFNHLGGASGSVVEESLEYFIRLGVPTAIVPPRTQRAPGEEDDLVFRTADEATAYACERAREEVERRPVLVVAQSVAIAHRLADELKRTVTPGVVVHLLAGDTVWDEAIYEHAGAPGNVVVSTQLSGRGVDIHLTPEAEANGGMVLLAVGRSLDARLDRQLRGRVGRRGAPHTTQFVVSLEDPLMRAFAIGAMSWVMDKAIPDDVPVESGMVSKAIQKAQRTSRRNRLQRFASRSLQLRTVGEIYDQLDAWFDELRRPAEDSPLSRIIERAADRVLVAADPTSPARSTDVSQTIAARLAAIVGDPTIAGRLEFHLAGITTPDDLAGARAVLVRTVSDAVMRNDEACDTAQASLTDVLVQSSDVRGQIEQVVLAIESAKMAAPADAGAEPVPAGLPGVHNGLTTEVDRSGAMTDAPDGDAGPPDPLDLATSTCALEDLRVSAQLLEDQRTTYQVTVTRTAVQIALETLYQANDDLGVALRRVVDEMYHEDIGPSAYHKVHARRASLAWGRIEADLAENLLFNLGRSAQPETLGHLFADRDARISNVITPPGRRVLRSVTDLPSHPKAAPRAVDDEVASSFLERAQVEVDQLELDRELAIRALRSLLAGAPLRSLQSAENVAAAYTSWRRGAALSLPIRKRRACAELVRLFLAYTHNQGLTPPFDLSARARAGRLRALVARTLTDAKMQLGLGALLSASVLFVMMATLGGGMRAVHLPAGAAFIDNLAGFSGAQRGNLGLFALTAIGAAAVLTCMFGQPLTEFRGTLPLERYVFELTAIVGEVLLIRPWSGQDAAAVVGRVGLVVVVLACSLLLLRMLWLAEQFTEVPVVAAVVTASTLTVGVAALVDTGWQLLGAYAFAVAILASGRFRAVPLRTRAFDLGADGNQPGDAAYKYEATQILGSPAGWREHAWSLVLSWTIVFSLDRLWRAVVGGHWPLGRVVGTTAYALILLTISSKSRTRATDPTLVADRLARMKQYYVRRSAHDTLSRQLDVYRARLRTIESSFLAVSVIIAVTLLSSRGIGAARFPSGLLLLTALVLGVDLARFVARTTSLRFGGSGSQPMSLMDDEAFGISADIRAARDRFRRRLALPLALFAFAAWLLTLIDVARLASALWAWVTRLL